MAFPGGNAFDPRSLFTTLILAPLKEEKKREEQNKRLLGANSLCDKVQGLSLIRRNEMDSDVQARKQSFHRSSPLSFSLSLIILKDLDSWFL